MPENFNSVTHPNPWAFMYRLVKSGKTMPEIVKQWDAGLPRNSCKACPPWHKNTPNKNNTGIKIKDCRKQMGNSNCIIIMIIMIIIIIIIIKNSSANKSNSKKNNSKSKSKKYSKPM